MLEKVNCRDFSSVSAYSRYPPTGVFPMLLRAFNQALQALEYKYLPIGKLLLHAISPAKNSAVNYSLNFLLPLLVENSVLFGLILYQER